MQLSFLIQTSRDQRSFASFPGLIAGYHVFRRLSMPRHPPCTLSSLTTFTDHRPTPLGKARNVQTAGNGSDQQLGRTPHATLAVCRTREPVARQKGARRLPAKTEKTLSPPPAGTGSGKPNAGSRGSCEACRHGGIPVRRPPKPSVEPLFTCQRTPDFSGPAERGRVSRQTKTAGGLVRVRLGASITGYPAT